MKNKSELFLTSRAVNNSLVKIITEIEDAGGELTPETESTLELLYAEKKELVKDLGSLYFEAKATEEALSSEIKRLTELKKKAQKTSEFCKRLMDKNLNGEKFDGGFFKVSYRKSKSVELDDLTLIDEIPTEYLRIKKELDKEKIKKLLKEGKPLPVGVKVVEKTNIIIK